MDSSYMYNDYCPRNSRHDEQGENNERIHLCWVYVCGLMGGVENAKLVSPHIAYIYDRKGTLNFACIEELPDNVKAFFRRAWAEIGNESEDEVIFWSYPSSDWDVQFPVP